jgi:hypothetical protein
VISIEGNFNHHLEKVISIESSAVCTMVKTVVGVSATGAP